MTTSANRATNTDALHFGASMALPASRTAEQARLMEDLGFEYMGAGEHFMRGRPAGPDPRRFAACSPSRPAPPSGCASVTSVTLAPFYHPLMLARMTATLDIASGGRLTLGVGVGGEFPMEYENAGLDIRRRGRRTDECLDALRRLWTEDSVTFPGPALHSGTKPPSTPSPNSSLTLPSGSPAAVTLPCVAPSATVTAGSPTSTAPNAIATA